MSKIFQQREHRPNGGVTPMGSSRQSKSAAASEFRHRFWRTTKEGRADFGFTILETIGVMAVVAILLAVLAPAVFKQIDRAARTREISDLHAISNALVLQTISTNSTKTVPSETTWAQAVATWTRQSVSTITTTPRGHARAFLVDTSGWFGAIQLPYTQSTGGTTNPPLKARLIIVSTIGRDLPVATGRPSSEVFNDIWDTPEGGKPARWQRWAGTGDDLVIQRINFEPLFHRLILLNRDVRTLGYPTFSIDSTSTMPLAPGGGNQWDRYYLDGSIVSFCDSNSTPVLRFPLTRDFSYVFEGSIWQDQISGDDSSEVTARDFANLSALFLAAQWYPGANQPGRGDQQGALVAMFNFMLDFALWANQFPHFPSHGANATQVPEYELLEDIVGTGSGINAKGFLNNFTGPNGLLNK